jgi:hypothetical protein
MSAPLVIVDAKQGSSMRHSTALVIVSPPVGPWGDRLWRIALSLQLVEGGSQAYWLLTPATPPEHDLTNTTVGLEIPDDDGVIDSLLLAIAAQLGNEPEIHILEETHNIQVDAEARTIAPYWEIAPETRQHLAEVLAPTFRLGIVTLEPNSLITPHVIEELSLLGFDVDVFFQDISISVRE